MKKAIIIGIIYLLTGRMVLYAQLSISANNSPPDSSAMLDIQSTSKGVLIPRMTKAQRNSINSPVNGLLVYQTDALAGLYYFSGSTWSMVNDPCGNYKVVYGNSSYHTVKIGSQCWLRENLDIGNMIPHDQTQSNNGIIEKYCNNGIEDRCNWYGGLYQWNEMMQYDANEGAQGICPSGWHIPSDGEWMILEGNMDGVYGVGNPVWDNIYYYRGFNAGKNLKYPEIWNDTLVNAGLFGFNALPAGGYYQNDSSYAFFWTSTAYISPTITTVYTRTLYYVKDGISRDLSSRTAAYSVRCIRD